MAIDKTTISAPCDGEVIKIEDVKDPVFSGKLMGDGFAVIPSNGNFVIPVSGVMDVVFETKHAYGIKNNEVNILVHIGIDTVNLNGEGFESFVSQGDEVKQGDKMCSIDFDLVKSKVPSLDTPVIITNKKPFEIIKFGKVKAGEIVAKLK